MKIHRTLLLAAASLGLASTAQAAGTERVVVERFSEPFTAAYDCSDFGPYDFHNLVEGTLKVRVTEVLSRDGELLRTVLHLVASETDTNSATDRTLTLRSAVHEVRDHVAGTITQSGKVFLGTAEGEGTYVQDTGRIVRRLDTGEPLAINGPHEAFAAGGIDVPVCDALAG